MNSKSGYCFLNGELGSTDDARLKVSDLGLQRGYGVFDYARTYNGELFHFDDHLKRLRHSTKSLHLDLSYSDQEITEMAYTAIEKSELNPAGVRLLLTGGYGDTAAQLKSPNFLVIAESLSLFSEKEYKVGVSVMTNKFQRELPQTKSLNYLHAMRLEPEKKQKGVFDILYHWSHGVTECPRGNFFIFKDDTLITPKEHVLLGITRKVVLQQAKERFKTEEREIRIEELHAADEAFITSTSKRIIPVVRVDDKTIGDGMVGANTIQLIEDFDRYVGAYGR